MLYSRKSFAAVLIIVFVALAAASLFARRSASPPDAAEARSGDLRFPATFPENFVQYARVDRGDGKIRDLFISRSALDAMALGFDLPDYAVLIIAGYEAQRGEDGAFLRDENGWFVKGQPFESFHIAEKRSNWRLEAFPAPDFAGAWNFGSFTQEGREPFDEDLAACFNCHQTTIQTDFVYTRRQIIHFARTGQTQYFYCPLAERVACPEEV